MKHTTPRDNNYIPEAESYSMLPSASVVYKYGIPRSAALNMLHNYWTISRDYEAMFEIYYLLHWEAGYFQQAMKDGTIERKGVTYQVIYHRCDSYSIGRNSNELLLSFRSLVEDYKAQPTVLVTIA